MKRNTQWIAVVLSVAMTALTAIPFVAQQTTSQNSKDEVALRAAMEKEAVQGDLKGAIEIYKKIADSSKDSSIAARALVRMAQAYEKLGDTESQRAYQRIIEKFSDQKDAAAQARTRLAALRPSPPDATKYKGLTKLRLDGYPASFWESVTPDGRYLEFVGHSQGGLVLHDLVTGEEKKIFVGDAAYKSDGVLSSDGKSVAFAGGAAGNSSVTGPWDVFVAQVGGGPAKALLNNKEYIEGSRPFGWSSDSKEIFALLERSDQTWLIAKVSVANGLPQIIKSLEWRVPEKLSVSPDGRFIAYDAPVSKVSPNREVFLLAVDGSGEVAAAEDPSKNTKPVWTPDGKAIAFTSSRLGELSLFSIAVNDGRPQGPSTLLRRNIGNHVPLGFTDDGLYYYRTGSEFSSTLTSARIDWDGGTISPEKPIGRIGGAGVFSSPRYSPDGQKLAYLSSRGISNFVSILVHSSNGESEVQTMFQDAGGLSWFPDGQSVMFYTREANGARGIHRIDLKSGEDLIKDRLDGAYPVPSPDGKTIYYLNSNFNILMSFNFETKQETELFRFQAAELLPSRGFVVSPDGEYIAYLESQAPAPENPGTRASVQTLAVISTAGGPVRRLRSPQGGEIRIIIQWSADSKNVLVQARNGAANQLWRVPADGGEPQKGPAMGNAVPNAISLRPDGKEIALNMLLELPGELWVDPDLLRVKTPNVAMQEDGIYAARLDPTNGRISGPAQLTVSSPGVECAPAWSPDGKAILFFRNQRQMILRTIDTGVEKIVQSSQPTLCPTVWFHDGHSVLMWPRGTTGTQPLRLDLNTGNSQIINISTASDAIALSTDDKTLFLTTYDEKSRMLSIESVNLDTLVQKRLWASPTPTETDDLVSRKLALSPDGRTLALVLWDSKSARLIRVGTDGTGYRVLYTAAKPRSDSGNPELWPGGLSWTHDGRDLLFMETKADHLRVMRVSADGGKPEFTGLDIGRKTLPGRNWHSISDLVVSPDGRRIAFWSPARPNIAGAASNVNR